MRIRKKKQVIPDLDKWSNIKEWYQEFSDRRSMVATELSGDTFD